MSFVTNRQEALEVLRRNVGFDDPERWIEFALVKKFKPVSARLLRNCPDCHASSRTLVGQYIYYSSLMRLWTCSSCGLVYSDVRIDSHLVVEHFDERYKDEDYFVRRRRLVTDDLVRVVDRLTPQRGRVLDIGGATGYFLARLQRRRPDLVLVLNDLSPTACEIAKSRWGFETICGEAARLDELSEGRSFDCIVASDVLYYEPEIHRFFATLKRITSPSGSAVFRVPNRLRLVRNAEALRRSLGNRSGSSTMSFFNPEHLYLFSAGYLRSRLLRLGFREVETQPSPPLLSRLSALQAPATAFARLVWWLSGRRAVMTPSRLMIARGLNGERIPSE